MCLVHRLQTDPPHRSSHSTGRYQAHPQPRPFICLGSIGPHSCDYQTTLSQPPQIEGTGQVERASLFDRDRGTTKSLYRGETVTLELAGRRVVM